MSRILSYPHMGTMKLYQINSNVHMSSLRKYFNDLFPNTRHMTTYKFVEPNIYVPLKHVSDKYAFPFVPEDDRMLIRTLQVFQHHLNIPYDTYINIQAKRTIINTQDKTTKDNHWKKFEASKVGIVNVSQDREYKFRDTTNNYVLKDTVITIGQGQMLGYDENNLIEYQVVDDSNKKKTLIYDELIIIV